MKNRWKFTSVADARRFWRGVRSVPWRTEGRKHFHEERYCLGLYLLALAEHDLLTYPIQVEQGRQHESPDFMITWLSGELTGLEVTRATEAWLQCSMTVNEKEYRRRETAAAASGDKPEPVCIPLSQAGWVDNEAEVEWCALIRKAIEQKVKKLPDFRPASRHDLLIYDDTPLPTVDRRKVLATLGPWAQKCSRATQGLGKISVIVSLDVLFDLGGDCKIFPYIDWVAPKIETAVDLSNFSERIEHAGMVAAKRAIEQHTEMHCPVYFMDSRGRLVKQTFDGHRFEVRIGENGEEVVVQELLQG